MTTPARTQRQDASLTRDLLYALRYYLWRRPVLLALAAIAVAAGLALNWNWLVAAGIAPILIASLPCVVMCGLGVCMVCRSGKKDSVAVRDAVDTAAPPSTLTNSATDRRSMHADPSVSISNSIDAETLPRPREINSHVAGASCCHDSTAEPSSKRTIDLEPNGERRNPHA